ncbi:site-2 protease family protein [Leptospira gomenensis]|uniref:Site-2 protease family protein n=1 Tax=Leptospira gomenensis TaxID=2484974 RepID=A0A5F1YQ17_9LEPT|nr:site-2 protease family protein [Leptospira gomenensis]TGK28054.1 site-2 protease family protein [Leptospira gomenensis]TGK37091.1 site-2 protease family protein [Leptospira gomenensis]TGK45727.1 site-2 protease family protein [Leptospira gomenensis]TGK59666.1 site-2 protease family protein [Leptospira gomenensis]
MKQSRPFTHIILFVLTFLTLTFQNEFLEIPFLPGSYLKELFLLRLPYSLSLIVILSAHEMGHFLAARYYGIKSTWPYFIPVPFAPIGTMGAVIRILEPIRNKKQLFDIGIWGPLMSLILSVPCYILGIYWSTLVPIQSVKTNPAVITFGESLFTIFVNQSVLGPFDPSLQDVWIHPLAQAGWVGLLVTAINLLPFGQLDGGHVIYSVFGEKYRNWIYYLFTGFLLLCFWNFSWLLWGFLIYFLIKVEHPFVPDPVVPLDRVRKIGGIAILLLLFFIFVPSPIQVGTDIHRPGLAEELWISLKSVFTGF